MHTFHTLVHWPRMGYNWTILFERCKLHDHKKSVHYQIPRYCRLNWEFFIITILFVCLWVDIKKCFWSYLDSALTWQSNLYLAGLLCMTTGPKVYLFNKINKILDKKWQKKFYPMCEHILLFLPVFNLWAKFTIKIIIFLESSLKTRGSRRESTLAHLKKSFRKPFQWILI